MDNKITFDTNLLGLGVGIFISSLCYTLGKSIGFDTYVQIRSRYREYIITKASKGNKTARSICDAECWQYEH